MEEYVSDIDGYTYDKESQAIVTSSENVANGNVRLKIVSVGNSHNGKQSREIKCSVKINDVAKFDKIYDYLSFSFDTDNQVDDIRTPLTLRTHNRRLWAKPLYSDGGL